MGKGGRGKPKSQPATAAATTTTISASDDKLLEQAAAANRAAVEAALAETASSAAALEGSFPTKAELLAELDKVTLFDLRSVGDGSGREPCLSPAGEYVFYVDESDAVAALEERKITNPDPMALGCTPLGRAFGLSEGRTFGFSTNLKCPMRLQGASSAIDAVGLKEATRLCPPTLRKQLNPRTGPLPMFSLEELVEGTEEAPYFFSHHDLVAHWMEKTGKKQEEFPQRLIITDLRVLIVRMMQVPQDWKTLKLVPTSSSVAWLEAAAAHHRATAEKARAEAEAEAADGPPPLLEDEPPPLLAE